MAELPRWRTRGSISGAHRRPLREAASPADPRVKLTLSTWKADGTVAHKAMPDVRGSLAPRGFHQTWERSQRWLGVGCAVNADAPNTRLSEYGVPRCGNASEGEGPRASVKEPSGLDRAPPHIAYAPPTRVA